MIKDLRRHRLRTVALYGTLVPILILFPIVLWKLDLPFISSTSGSRYRVFEIFAFCISLTVVVIAATRLRKTASGSFAVNLPTVLFALLACYFAAQVTEFRPQSSDWLSYERAARAIIDGKNPYLETGYLYPPLTALALASMYQMTVWVSGLLHIAASSEFAWQGVFYLYQCLQFFLVIGAIVLCFRFAKTLGAPDTTAAVLISLLFVFNTPLLRTLHFHQVNLWLFDLIMLAVLFVNAPVLSGLALAVATHGKLYAAIVLLPFMLMKRFGVVLSALIGIAIIVALQTAWGTSTKLWQQYLDLAAGFPAGTTFRDNGLHSILYNTLAFVNRIVNVEHDTFAQAVRILTLSAAISVVLYFGRRYYKRERSFAVRSTTDEAWAAMCRLYGNVFDAIAMVLIISPLVWEHHYILTIPLIIWVILTQGKQKPWRVGVAAFLICAIPIFDVYPFSYHRIAGLLLLLSASPPKIPATPIHDSPFTILG